MKPQIEFKHVLGELSVNRNDPCEVLRELISNSYDAGANNIFYAPIKDHQGFIFLDNGSGLDAIRKSNGITPWEAFFSIGKSTKKKGDSIGYKCQGSKLCFACSRILVATAVNWEKGIWNYKIIDNPRTNLDVSYDISPTQTKNIEEILDDFFPTISANTTLAISHLKEQLTYSDKKTGTLVVIDNLDTESYGKYFSVGKKAEESYVVNYIKFYTSHGDVRQLTANQGFTPSQKIQISKNLKPATMTVLADKKYYDIPFGYPFLPIPKLLDPALKFPSQVSRLRDGRFYSRSAKKFSLNSDSFSIILSIDGNRRAHDEYKHLARKGQAKSGIKLSDQRGVFISVKGIKICKYPDLLAAIDGYEVLSEGESPSHYSLILDGDFDLVTNRSALSKKAFDTLTHPAFVAEIKKFLDSQKASDKVFSELLSRLKKESSESLLNEQIENLERAKKDVKSREKFRLIDVNNKSHLYLSPRPGDEYLVGVLYSELANFLPKNAGFENYWKRVITFSTQGIDSLGLLDELNNSPLADQNICSIEYKFEFNNNGPFNHALAVVDFIVAWVVDIDDSKQVKDAFTCYGNISKVTGNNFEWKITDINNTDGANYPQSITVICLKKLIEQSFLTSFSTPPK